MAALVVAFLVLLSPAVQGLNSKEVITNLEISRDGHRRARRDLPKYQVGQLMEYQILDGPEAGSWVKCSITGMGDEPDLYNIYAWSADPHHRHMKNVPAEILVTQAEQDAKRKAVADAEQKLREEVEAKRKAIEDAQRAAREAEEARKKAIEDAERREREETERIAREAAEAKRAADEAEARRKAQEDARIEAERVAKETADREEAARLRKIRLKARWEEVKALKKQAELEQKAKEDEEERLWLAEQAERRARGEKITTTPRPLADPENIRVVLRFDGKPDLTLKVRRSLRLRALMSVAAEKMGVDPDYVRFVVGSKVFSPEETAERFGRHDKVLVKMEPMSGREIYTSKQKVKMASASPGRDSLASAFDIGDFVTANASDAHGNIVAVPCTIKAKGTGQDTFEVHFVFEADGAQNIHNVPAKLLQKIRGKQYASSVKFFRESPLVAKAAVQNLAQAIDNYKRHPVEEKQATVLTEPTEPETVEVPEEVEIEDIFEVGNFVELRLKDGSALPATVTVVNEEPKSYDIHFLFAPDMALRNLRDLHSLPARHLRRLKATPFVEAVRALKEDTEKAQRLLEAAQQELGDQDAPSDQ